MFGYQKVKFERVYWSIALIERVKKRDYVFRRRFNHLSPCFNFKISHVKVESRVSTSTMFSHKSYRIARLFHYQQLLKSPPRVDHMFCYQKVKFERVYWSIALIERVKKR
jgi:hypothetical protein